MRPAPPAPLERLLTLGLVALLALVVVSYWLPPTWLWGLNHGRWLPWPVRIGFPLAGFLLILAPVHLQVGAWLVHRLGPVVLDRRPVAYLLVPAAGAVIFWLLRDRTHMLGDGQTLAVMLDGDNLYHGFDWLTYHLLARIYQLRGAGGPQVAFQVTALISALSGAAYLGAAAWSARRLAASPGPKILLYGLLVFTPSLLLFFGYMEVYAPLAVAMVVFVTFFILYREGRAGLVAVAISWSLGFLFHLNALFLAPLLVVALFRPPPHEQDTWVRRLWTVVWPVLAALGVVMGIYAAGGYGSERLATDFGHVGTGDGILLPLSGPDGLLTWRHLKDSLNLLLLLVPLPGLLLLMSGSWRAQRGPAWPWLWGGSIWLVVLLALVHLKLGAVRDWDLFAPHMSLVVMAGWYAATGGSKENSLPDPLVSRLLIVAVVLAVPWFLLNASPQASLARLEAVAADLSPYPRGLLHEQFAYHYQAAGQRDETIRHYRKAGEVCPNHPRFHAIYGTFMLNLGQMDEAVAAYDRAVTADPEYVYGLKMGLLARVLKQDFEGALKPAHRLEQLQAQDSEAAAAHGTAAQQTGRNAEAIAAFLRAFSLDSARLDLLERGAGLQLLERDFAASEKNFRRLLVIQPTRTSAALGLADALWQSFLAPTNGRTVEANRERLNETLGLIDRVIAAGPGQAQQTGGLDTWRDQVRARLAELGN